MHVLSIIKKINKRGMSGSFRIVATEIKIAYTRWFPCFLRPVFYYNLFKLIFTPVSDKKRILGVWDYKALPWSVGDPLVFIETLSILKIKSGAIKIDICVVYDHDNPIGNRGTLYSSSDPGNIYPNNAQDYMIELLPLFSACPYLGSIFQFNSREEFRHFLKTNIERYDVFPSLGDHLGEKYNFVGGPPILNPMQEFYNEHGYIPYLRIGERDKSWAQWLYLNHLPDGSVPVVLSLKQTLHRVGSNADSLVWLSFIDRCKSEFPEVVFVVVGLREEVFEGLRNRTNVFIAKDFGTSVVEDLALIRTSLMYIGTSSGVNMIAMFSDHPYLILQMEKNNYLRHGLKPDDKFSFVLPAQKIFSTDIMVTPEFLFKEFRELYLKLDKNKWCETTLRCAHNKHGHPIGRGVGEQVSNENMTLI